MSKTDIYKHKKSELGSMCKQRKLGINGTKLDLALRLAKDSSLSLTTAENEYDGNISDLPNTTSRLRALGNARLFVVAIYSLMGQLFCHIGF